MQINRIAVQQKQKLILLLSIVFSFILILVAIACASNSSSSPNGSSRSSDEITAIRVAMNSIQNGKENDESLWKTGPLSGGIAILSQGDRAYWYKDGILYAANGTAKMASPNLNYAPTGIGFSEIEKAVK